MNSQLLHWIHHGRIAVAPGIAAPTASRCEFADGRREEFDTIVWCTGYRVAFPFLDHAAAAVAGRRAAAHRRVRAAEARPGRLYFVGLAAPRGPQLPVYSRQAALVARMIRLQERLADPLAETFTSHGHRSTGSTSSAPSGRGRSPRPRTSWRGWRRAQRAS